MHSQASPDILFSLADLKVCLFKVMFYTDILNFLLSFWFLLLNLGVIDESLTGFSEFSQDSADLAGPNGSSSSAPSRRQQQQTTIGEENSTDAQFPSGDNNNNNNNSSNDNMDIWSSWKPPCTPSHIDHNLLHVFLCRIIVSDDEMDGFWKRSQCGMKWKKPPSHVYTLNLSSFVKGSSDRRMIYD